MKRLRVDPIACDGSGLCAELLPERIALDDWGYPIVDPEPLTPELEAHARRAVVACPLLALRLVSARPGERDGARERGVRPGTAEDRLRARREGADPGEPAVRRRLASELGRPR